MVPSGGGPKRFLPTYNNTADPAGYNAVPVMLGANRDEAKLFMMGDPELTGTRLGFLPKIKDLTAYNRITGYYSDGNRVNHGFVGKASATMTTFDVPGANQGTTPTGINEQGTITGTYNDGHAHGFVRHTDGSFETFSVMTDTTPTAINNKGAVTGYSQFIGFVRTADGTITQFSVPGGTNT